MEKMARENSRENSDKYHTNTIQVIVFCFSGFCKLVALVRRLPEKHLKRFSRNVIRLRNAAGLTQERLAEKVEISPRYFQSIEAGKRWPSIGVLVRLRNSLKCDWRDLFYRMPRL